MKLLSTILLILLSINTWALSQQDNYLNPAFYLEDTNTEDTANIKLSDLSTAESDSSINISTTEKSDSTFSPNITSYQSMDIDIIEDQYATRIIISKDNDTIQQYEMNFDNLGDVQFSQSKPSEEKKKAFNFPKKKKNRFKGHWSGFEVGLNNYLTSDMSITPEDPYMEINTGKSWNFNLNLAQVSVPLFRDRVGLVSGLGFEWNNYHFSNLNTIEKDPISHTIQAKDLSSLALKKNRLQTTYLTAPLLLEAQLGGKKNKEQRIAISGGVIAGLKLGSHTKYKTADEKQKTKDDLYLQSFRYGFTSRINYDGIGLFFNYYATPLFVQDKGPELYPFAAGLIMSFE